MKKLGFLLLVLLLFPGLYGQDFCVISKGSIDFTSDAPLELINASSDQVQGVLKLSDRSFAFRVPMKSFKGFNSTLQQTHFNENYVESEKYPYTSFEGKIIEEIDLKSPGVHTIRGKGKFICHGIEQERIIKCKMKITDKNMIVNSQFSVMLDDHNIKIPSVVSQKIAEEILISVEIELVHKN